MIKNKVLKILTSIIILMIFIIGQVSVFAAGTSETINLQLSEKRVVKNGNSFDDENTNIYKMRTGADHPVYQIVTKKSNNEYAGNNFYCVNGNYGSSWRDNHTGYDVTYDTKYDLSTDREEINSQYNNNDDYKTTTNTANGKNYYSQLMWLFDNFLVSTETDYSDGDINNLLAKAGIVYGKPESVYPQYAGEDEFDRGQFAGKDIYFFDKSKLQAINSSSAFANGLYNSLIGNMLGNSEKNYQGYAYEDSNGTVQPVRLSKELIETIQQVAVWYFTDYKYENNSEFNCYTSNDATQQREWLIKNGVSLINEKITVGSGEIPTGAILQEQASILLNYFIDSANKAANSNPPYTGAKGTIEIKFSGGSTADQYVESGNYYKFGPFKVNTTGNATIQNVTASIGTTNSISGIVIENASGSEITKPTEGQNFYVKVPKTAIDGSSANEVKFKVTGKTNVVTKILRVVNTGNEQPVVELIPGTENIHDEIPIPLKEIEIFDLALRKIVYKVDGSTTIYNENGYTDANKAERTTNGAIKADPSTIASTDTAKYTHRKDPIAVKTGSKVIYRVYIYNEGDIDGYASKITDTLASGLKKSSSMNSQVTSHKGNKYNVTTEGNNIILTLTGTPTVISAYKNRSTLDYDYVDIECEVTQVAEINDTKHYLSNIAYISEAKNGSGEVVARDRDNTESTPNNTNVANGSNGLNVTDKNKIYKGNSNKNIFNDTDNSKDYFKGQEDDDDFETVVILPKQIDIALRKFISKVSTDGNFESLETTTTYNRAPQVDTSKLKAGTAETAIYNHSKQPVELYPGDYVLYTLRAYNEGDVDAYAYEITDYLPENLDFVESTDPYISEINRNWSYNSNSRKVQTKWMNIGGLGPAYNSPNAETKLNAFDAENDDGHGSGLSYVDVQIVCRVNKNATSDKKLTNIAEITIYKDENGNPVPENKDRDSTQDDLDYPDEPSTYKDNELNKDYVPGQEDDDDFEKLIIKKKVVDLALTKFITAVSNDDKIEDGEYLTPDTKIGSKTNEYLRATVADTTGLKAGTSTNATYTERKDIEPLVVSKGSYVLYNIRVYNEGEVDVFAGRVTDYLPENLEFVKGEFNDQYGWKEEGQSVYTEYLSHANGTDKILKAFDKDNDDGKGSGMDYKDLPILCKVSDKAESGKKMINTAEITKYEDENGKELTEDIDSEPENVKAKHTEKREQDDDDYEIIIIKNFDLALRKFITEIDTYNAQQKKSVKESNYGREPKLSYENGQIVYTHPKDVVRTTVDSVVTYTLRVFNEGDIDGFAEEISDDMPEHLEFLPEHTINQQYKWVMYDKDGKSTTKVSEAVKIKTDYTSKANGELLMKNDSKLTENPNLLKAFDKEKGITDTNPDYVDVRVAFKVKDPNSNKTVIVNKAQISKDYNEKGIPDIDSHPDIWIDGEDDQDYENVAVDYFDLSLLKYVTKAIVTEDGKTKTTKTGNNGSKTDVTPKVEIHRKKLNKTIVKFEFTIKITNEGDIAGYAKEITDYVPKGLKFYKEDNKGWKDEGNNVISTELLKDTLLQPGQSATVKVILRWINGENNLGLKTNVAEISKDYNEKGVPDRDSTPDNKKKGEDDIDDAPVLLTISTGIENTVKYATVALVILLVLGTGLATIKKYVL